MSESLSRSLTEKLLYLGIVSFFLWPFIQLRSVNAVPVMSSDKHLRASIALKNIMNEYLAKPFDSSRTGRSEFKLFEGESNSDLFYRVELLPFSKYSDLYRLRVVVRWGSFPFSRTLSLERYITRSRS